MSRRKMASILPSPTRLERLRALVITGLALTTALGWAYLLYQDWAMRHMDTVDMAMPSLQAWGTRDLTLVFIMWAIMMVAMMLPSAAPMIWLFAKLNHAHRSQQKFYVATWIFVAGYLVVWTLFSLFATLAQWALHETAMISPMMVATSPLLGGAVLIAAGIYQWTPLKLACLAHCRSPLSFLMTGWRDGAWGAFNMGLRHGAYCTGCCWLLMALLFVVGVMNLWWIAALSFFVLAEKTVPGGIWVSRISGLLLLAWGAWLILQ